MLCNSNVNKSLIFFLASLNYRLRRLKQQRFLRNLIFFMKSLKSKKKKLALCFIMLVEKYGWAIQKSLFAQTNQDSTFCQTREDSKIFKGATKSYFTHYSYLVIIFFKTGLYKCVFFINSFWKNNFLFFCDLVFLPALS